MGIYQASSDVSKTAWAAYENFADKYSGREFDLRFEKSEYERVTKRGEELYKAYEEVYNKSYDDMMAMCFPQIVWRSSATQQLYTSDALQWRAKFTTSQGQGQG